MIKCGGGSLFGTKNQGLEGPGTPSQDRLRGGRPKASPPRPSVSCPPHPDGWESLFQGSAQFSPATGVDS
jgi:hypothetical protein